MLTPPHVIVSDVMFSVCTILFLMSKQAQGLGGTKKKNPAAFLNTILFWAILCKMERFLAVLHGMHVPPVHISYAHLNCTLLCIWLLDFLCLLYVVKNYNCTFLE